MDYRFIAKIIIEAETPLYIGTGKKGLTMDSLVAKDANLLPYIPGTGLCGVLRHSFNAIDGTLTSDIFGFAKESEGQGSRLKVSAAHLIGEDGETVIEGLKDIDYKEGFYSYFNRLPERDHVRINHKGAGDNENHGKFEEELVHKGTRFAFELELIGNEEDAENWYSILKILAETADI